MIFEMRIAARAAMAVAVVVIGYVLIRAGEMVYVGREIRTSNARMARVDSWYETHTSAVHRVAVAPGEGDLVELVDFPPDKQVPFATRLYGLQVARGVYLIDAPSGVSEKDLSFVSRSIRAGYDRRFYRQSSGMVIVLQAKNGAGDDALHAA